MLSSFCSPFLFRCFHLLPRIYEIPLPSLLCLFDSDVVTVLFFVSSWRLCDSGAEARRQPVMGFDYLRGSAEFPGFGQLKLYN
jgi:hypothetical protein